MAKAKTSRRAEKPFVRDLRALLTGTACLKEVNPALRAAGRSESWQDAWSECADGWRMEWLLWHTGRGPYARMGHRAGEYSKGATTRRFIRAVEGEDFDGVVTKLYDIHAVDGLRDDPKHARRRGNLRKLANLIRKFWPRAPRLPRSEGSKRP